MQQAGADSRGWNQCFHNEAFLRLSDDRMAQQPPCNSTDRLLICKKGSIDGNNAAF